MNKEKLLQLSPLLMAGILSACGGGSGGGSDSDAQANETVTLSGQVIDGPIADAKVCVFADGKQATNSAGTEICSSATDANGNYTVQIPKDLGNKFLSLYATKGSEIKLTSVLGSLDDVVAKADSSNKIDMAQLPAAKVTHFTTADFALADADRDGVVTATEATSYVKNEEVRQKVAALIKAVVDFRSQYANLVAGSTTDTLKLAIAAAHGQTLGSTGQSVDAWYADANNAAVVNEVRKDAATGTDLTDFINGRAFVHEDSMGIAVVEYQSNGTAVVWSHDKNEPAEKGTAPWSVNGTTITLQSDPVFTLELKAREGNWVKFYSNDGGDEVAQRVVPFTTAELADRSVVNVDSTWTFNSNGTGVDTGGGLNGGSCNTTWAVEGNALKLDYSACNDGIKYVYRFVGVPGTGEQKIAIVETSAGATQRVFADSWTFKQ